MTNFNKTFVVFYYMRLYWSRRPRSNVYATVSRFVHCWAVYFYSAACSWCRIEIYFYTTK